MKGAAHNIPLRQVSRLLVCYIIYDHLVQLFRIMHSPAELDEMLGCSKEVTIELPFRPACAVNGEGLGIETLGIFMHF